MRLLLDLYGWRGEILRSSELARAGPIGSERSARLADLTRAARCDVYLCGQGGRRYLRDAAFIAKGMTVTYFRPPEHDRRAGLTALAALAETEIAERSVDVPRAVTGVSGGYGP